jgi:hypothetical protein
MTLRSQAFTGDTMNFEQMNEKWLADDMPFAFEPKLLVPEEEQEVLPYIPPAPKHKWDF